PQLVDVRSIEENLHPLVLLSLKPSASLPLPLGDGGGEGSVSIDHARSTRTTVPARTFLKRAASPTIRPNTLTGLARRLSSPRLAGVRPKKMQNADPGGQ